MQNIQKDRLPGTQKELRMEEYLIGNWIKSEGMGSRVQGREGQKVLRINLGVKR